MKAAACAILVGGIALGILALFQVPFPTVFTVPLMIVVVGIGATIVRTRRKNGPASLVISLVITAIALIILWLFQTPTAVMWIGGAIIFVLIFGAEFMPRKKK
jgi:hypothetical protein